MRPVGGVAPAVNELPILKVEVLYSEGCPGGEASARVLREVLSQTCPATGVGLIRLSSRELLDRGVPGSPTILVNGRDLFPTGEAPSGSSCRLYATPEGPKGHPTAGMVRDALRAAGVGSAAGS